MSVCCLATSNNWRPSLMHQNNSIYKFILCICSIPQCILVQMIGLWFKTTKVLDALGTKSKNKTSRFFLYDFQNPIRKSLKKFVSLPCVFFFFFYWVSFSFEPNLIFGDSTVRKEKNANRFLFSCVETTMFINIFFCLKTKNFFKQKK